MPRRPELPLLAALLCAACAPSSSDDALRPAAPPVPATAEESSPVPAPGPATVDASPGQQVLLYHCGVQPVSYDNRSWEVEDPPFDMGSAPKSFSGFGTFRRDGDVLTFRDRKGARLTFTPNDGTPDPYNCA